MINKSWFSGAVVSVNAFLGLVYQWFRFGNESKSMMLLRQVVWIQIIGEINKETIIFELFIIEYKAMAMGGGGISYLIFYLQDLTFWPQNQ